MLEEGYAAVGSRKVAEFASVSVTLVYYYFPNTDDLFRALYRYTSTELDAELEEALASDSPLENLWKRQMDPGRAALGVEFLALANHRKAIRSEIAAYAEKTRAQQAKALSKVLDRLEIDGIPLSATCLATFITSITRTILMENGVGISLGHEEMQKFVMEILRRIGQNAVRPGSSN